MGVSSRLQKTEEADGPFPAALSIFLPTARKMGEADGQPAEDGGAKPRLVQIETGTGCTGSSPAAGGGDVTLFSLLRRLASGVFSARIRASFAENAPRLREACENTARHLLLWTRRGSPFRALLVISVGTIILLALTGLTVFMLFFLAATFNAIVISLLMSLAAAGGFLALFFAFLTAIYIGALSVAVFILSITTISTIIPVLVATGWIGFLWAIWLTAKKSMDLTKQSLSVTGSALSAYSTAWRVHYQQPKKGTE